MPRSHRPRKRHVPKRVELDPMGLAHGRASLLPHWRRQELVDIMRAAFQGLRMGQGNAALLANMADSMNVAEALAQAGIASDKTAEFSAGQAALHTLHQRHASAGSWVMRGQEIAALDTAAELHEVQLEFCTQGELVDAIQTVQRRVQQALEGNASPTAILCVATAQTQETRP